MLSPYQLENITSLVNGDLVLLERKYRAIPNLELRERWFNHVPSQLLLRDGERSWWKSVNKIGWLLMIQTLWHQRLRSALSPRRQLLRQSTCTYLFGNIPLDINNWLFAHSRPTVEGDEPKLPSAGANCKNQTSPTNSINNITCVSDNFQRQLDILSPYQ